MCHELSQLFVFCRHETLRQYAQKYAEYAERTYTDGCKQRLSQITIEKAFRTWGFLGKETTIRDYGLGGPAKAAGYWEWKGGYGKTRRLQQRGKACSLYTECVERLLEIAVSRQATLETFKVWSLQYPGSVQANLHPTRSMQGNDLPRHQIFLRSTVIVIACVELCIEGP